MSAMPAPEESETEPKPAERDQETAHPMPSFEEYLKIREAATARWRGLNLVYGVIYCGATSKDTLVFIPVERAKQLAAIHGAIKLARTWREFQQMISVEDWNELVAEIRQDDWTPDPDEAFDCFALPGYEDGDYPEWPQQEMMWWLPPHAIASYATMHQTVMDGPYLWIDPARTAQVVESLKSAGHACFRDDALVRQACGG
jgi:hypothetical protein